MRSLRVLAIVLFCGFLCDCSVMGVRPYEPYFKNTQELAKVKYKFSGVAVNPTPATKHVLSEDELECRLTTYSMPANQKLHDYIAKGLTDELDAGGKIDPNAKQIVVQVNQIESDTSGMDKGKWLLDFTYTVGRHTQNVKTSTQYESAFEAATACRNTAAALQDALRENFMGYFKALAGDK